MVQAGLVDTASCVCDKLVAQDPAMPWTVLARPRANAPGRQASTERPARVVSLLLPAQCLRRAALLHARFFPGKRHGATAREETTSGHPGPSSKIQPFTADADHQVACPALASAVPLPPPPPPPPSPSPACLASDRRTAGWQGETRGASLT
ncbi:hypothetical protein PCL_11384 [Purpureocillium lilacinum]|uniref:Uncharacterized protein n=1 Tax=Purpureocillium lilacinum TaxID=33203 RepID=A0A2U3E9W2_PURLI|nr:hypothetical protein PCL_11384 [Purpureocillium lilacinum]